MTFINDTGSTTSSFPVFDYSSRDYSSVITDLVNRIPVYMPEWTSTSQSDFGIVLLEMYAYVADLLGYYMDRLAGEAFIQTATQAVSVVNLAAMLDYQPTLSIGATATLQITIGPTITGPYVIPVGTQFATVGTASQASLVFETDAVLTIAGLGSATPSFTGSVVATQGVTHSNETVASSDGSINQVYPLLYNPVSANGFTVFVDLGIGPQSWTYVQTIINSGPFDAVYTSFVDADGVFYIIFGDGVNGLVPTLGSPITATYQTNSGALGNVGARTINQPVSALVGVTGVTNPLSASGGTGAQSIASIRQSAPASLKTLNRAVTVGDIETLAGQVSGVEWTSAIEATYQLVNLFICPFGGGPVSSILQSAILNYVNPLTMANTTVTVSSATYVPVNISVNVVAFPNFGNTTVKTGTAAVLSNLFALQNTGFATRISLGLVYQVVLSQYGVNWAIVTGLSRGMLTTFTSALVHSTVYTSLTVSPLPQSVITGDSLTLTSLDGLSTQLGVVVAAPGAVAGATTIPVISFTANAAYPIGSAVQDVTGTNDCVMLPNEIPIAGTFTINVTGGFIGS